MYVNIIIIILFIYLFIYFLTLDFNTLTREKTSISAIVKFVSLTRPRDLCKL